MLNEMLVCVQCSNCAHGCLPRQCVCICSGYTWTL